jgi:hypothetical protein
MGSRVVRLEGRRPRSYAAAAGEANPVAGGRLHRVALTPWPGRAAGRAAGAAARLSRVAKFLDLLAAVLREEV